jgi:hypothetical protein
VTLAPPGCCGQDVAAGMSKEISFKVEGRPPAKDGAQSIFGARHSHTPRVFALLHAARRETQRRGFEGFGSLPIGLELRVACGRDHGRSDATNYLGGVGDVLEDKARRRNLDHLGDLASFGLYANDKQIEEVHFHWEASERLSYTVRLWALEPARNAQDPGRFTRASLKAEGFVGWVSFKQMLNQDRVPRTGGVYVITRSTSGDPKFLQANPGGRFKGKDPTVAEEALRANWVAGAEIIYIGKADDLRRRLGQFADFGAGKPVGHWGGRLIWQLAESKNLLVAWKETPSDVPVQVEAALIAQFRDQYGKPPFANEPHRLGD